jgi:hypothetical protein
MSILPQPPKTSAILGGSYSPWQAPLAALFQGLSAAGQPGGWANFGPAVTQANQTFAGQQMDNARFQLVQEQAEREQQRFEEEQRTANEKRAREEAEQQEYAAMFTPLPSGPAGPDERQPGRAAILSGYDDQTAAMLGAWGKANPEGAAQFIMEQRLNQPKDEWKLETFREGDQEVTAWINPRTQEVRSVAQGPAWAPKQQQEMAIDFNGDGKPDFVMGGGAGKLTEDQSKSTVQIQLGLDADAYLDQNEAVLTDLIGNMASRGGTLGNYVKSDAYRQAEQQASILAEGYYRSQTGASAPESELGRMVRQIVPVPGDDPGTIALKRQTRKTWIAAMKLRAGPGGQVDVTPPLQPETAPAPAGPQGQASPAPTKRVKVDASGNVIP